MWVLKIYGSEKEINEKQGSDLLGIGVLCLYKVYKTHITATSVFLPLYYLHKLESFHYLSVSQLLPIYDGEIFSYMS